MVVLAHLAVTIEVRADDLAAPPSPEAEQVESSVASPLSWWGEADDHHLEDAHVFGLVVGINGLAAAAIGGVLTGIGYETIEMECEGECELNGFKVAGPIVVGFGVMATSFGIALLAASSEDFGVYVETTDVGGLEIPTGRFQF